MADTDAVNGATETQLPSEQVLQMEEDERREEEERKKSREPPIVFKEAYDVILPFNSVAFPNNFNVFLYIDQG